MMRKQFALVGAVAWIAAWTGYAALSTPATVAQAQTVTVTSCAGVPRPVPGKLTIFEPNAPQLTGGGVLAGEVFVPWPPEVGVVERDGGREYTFTDKGELEVVQCPDDGAPWTDNDTRWTTVTRNWVATGVPPACWELRVVEIGPSCDGPDITGYEFVPPGEVE